MTTKRGARPIASAEPASAPLDGELLDERSQQLAVMNEQQQAVIDQFGDGLPWSPEHYEAEIRQDLGRSAESFLRAGRRLLVVRACTAHGEWAGMLRRLNLGDDTALHMMAWARQIGGVANPERVRDLTSAATTIGRMIELAKLPPEQFQELAEHGQTGELALDEVAVMSRDELRAAVREARADMQAKDDRAAKRESDIEALQKQVRRLKGQRTKATPGETALELRQFATTAALQARADISAQGEDVDSLFARFTQLREHAINEGGAESMGDEHDQFMAGLVGELLGELRRVRDHFGLPIVNDHGAPDWQQGV
ncbi:MAG: hypothetical protein WDA70_03760 [Lysobacteraceae bacterium]